MVNQETALRANPGGNLMPWEVVGRDDFIATLWHTLERQSVLLTSERRMGKTSVMLKMDAEPNLGFCPIKRSLQGITSPQEFAREFIADVERAVPGLLTRSLWKRLRASGLTKVGTAPFSIEFEPAQDQSWKLVVDETLAALDEVDDTVVIFWDELPHMIADIRDSEGPQVAREVLDLLRVNRERRAGVRMVLSGSLGIHHVVAQLRAKGGMWVPTHDMLGIDVPPLLEADAVYLAGELLRNESVECGDRDAVAQTIAGEVDNVPYYIHHTVHLLRSRRRTNGSPVDTGTVEEMVKDAIENPLDPWELKHYLDRIPVYYGERADLARAILDRVATSCEPLGFDALHRGIGALLEPPPAEETRALLDLLCKDYYLTSKGGGYRFLRHLVQRAWIARRPA
jgi:hypothetical protein